MGCLRKTGERKKKRIIEHIPSRQIKEKGRRGSNLTLGSSAPAVGGKKGGKGKGNCITHHEMELYSKISEKSKRERKEKKPKCLF